MLEKKIKDLREKLNLYNYHYYVNNNPIVSDYIYDMMMKDLEKLEELHPEFYDKNSPTLVVGSDLYKDYI